MRVYLCKCIRLLVRPVLGVAQHSSSQADASQGPRKFFLLCTEIRPTCFAKLPAELSDSCFFNQVDKYR